jgi:asparagine N-glycosylation enzyme membrane subunit Stt3
LTQNVTSWTTGEAEAGVKQESLDPTGPQGQESRSQRFDTFIILGTSIAAFLIRCLTLPAMTRDGLRLVSMDDYGHLRRAMATLVDFPRVPAFDAYLNHPEGAIWIWPPGFDFTIAAFARLVFGADAELAEVTLVAALIPPILGAFSIWPLFAFTRRSFGPAEARWAVCLYAVLPAAVAWSSFGHADQHCAEALSFVLVLAGFARILSGERALVEDRLGVALAAFACVAAVLVWQGAIFLVPLIAVAALIARRPLPVAVALLFAAIVIGLFAWGYPGPVTYISFGRFQPLFLALWAGLLGLAVLPRWGLALAAAVGSGVALLWPPIAGGVRHLLSATSGGEVIAGGYEVYPKEWLRLIFEYRPLFSSGLSRPLGELSGGLLVIPAIVGWWAFRAWRHSAERSRLALPVLAALATGAMAVSQRRYVYYFVVMVAVAVATAVVVAARRGRQQRAVAVGLLLLALAPTVPPLIRQTRAETAAGEDVFWTLQALGALDPPEIEPFRSLPIAAGEVPGVLAPWSLGHLVTLFTGRPAVSDNFGYGFDRQSWIYSAPPGSDPEVARKLERWNCRYLITAALDPVLNEYAAAAGHGSVPPDQMLVNRVHRSSSSRPLEFLELVLVSRTGTRSEEGTFLPRLKVFRISPSAGESGLAATDEL